MKSTLRILWITALALMIGFSMTACPDGGGPGGGGGPIPLSAGQWKHGELTSTTTEVQYSFTVEAGKSYALWWNDSGDGDGFKTGNIKVSAKWSDETELSPQVSGVDKGWTTYQKITSDTTRTVIITVEPFDDDSFGTYSIAYDIGTSLAGIITTYTKPDSTWDKPPANPVPLTENTWKNGTIDSSAITDWGWYTLSVTEDTEYKFWWDEKVSGSNGSGMFTGTVGVTAYYSDGKTSPPAFSETDTAWTSAKSFTPDRSGTVYIRVRLYNTNFSDNTTNPGSYAIVYSTATTRPTMSLESVIEAELLTENTWKFGTIAAAADTDWYKVSVTSGTTYSFWWSESDNNIVHTGDIAVTGYNNDQTTAFTQTNTGWTTAKTYTATGNGTLYINVKLYSSYSGVKPGTYGIVYSTSATKPSMNLGSLIQAVPLTENTWKDGEIATDGEQWYSMQVSAGTYRLWGNDTNWGDDTKTGRIYIYGFYNDGSSAFSRSNSSSTAITFTPTANDTVYIKVIPYSSTTAGTYAIVCSSTFTTRPPVIQNPIALTERQWKNGEITTSSKIWYSFQVSAGTYYLWWDDSSQGSGTKTGNIEVSAYGDKAFFTDIDSAWSSSRSITVTSAGTVYILVEPYTSSSAGTFGIVYSTADNRPIDFQTVSPTALSANTWKHGYIAGTDTMNWYSISVTSGTTYYLWWNEKSSTNIHSADITVSGYYNDNTLAFTAETDTAWTTSISFTPAANGTLYISVKQKEYNSFGTYGIVYSTSSARPAIDLSTIGAKTLTSDTWENGELNAQNNVLWYSFPISNYLYLYWDDSGTPNSGTKTGNIKVSACRSDGSPYVGNSSVNLTGIDNAYNSPQRVNTSSGDTMVYIKVEPNSANSFGTFRIVLLSYSTNITPTRP